MYTCVWVYVCVTLYVCDKDGFEDIISYLFTSAHLARINLDTFVDPI